MIVTLSCVDKRYQQCQQIILIALRSSD